MSFQVTLVSNGRKFDVGDDETILHAAFRNGLSLNFKCGNGSCKTCCARIVSGSVHYPWREPLALTAEELQAGSVLVCQAAPLSDLELDAKIRVGLMEEIRLQEIKMALDGIHIKKVKATVVGLDKLSHDVMRLQLKLHSPLNWVAGQYANIGKNGTFRDFSIGSLPSSPDIIEMHIRRVPNGQFTNYIFSDLRLGDELDVEGPLGTFFLRSRSTRPMLLVAGGTGFAPIKALIESRIEEGSHVPMVLYWGVRQERDLYLADTVVSWTKKLADFSFVPVLSECEPGSEWTGRRGFLHDALAADIRDAGAMDIYVAGPPPMVEAVNRVLSEKGARQDRLFTDSFEFALVPSADVA